MENRQSKNRRLYVTVLELTTFEIFQVRQYLEVAKEWLESNNNLGELEVELIDYIASELDASILWTRHTGEEATEIEGNEA